MELNEEKNENGTKNTEGTSSENLASENPQPGSVFELPTQKEYRTQDSELGDKVSYTPISAPDLPFDDEIRTKKVSFFPSVRTIKLEKRPKWERFRGLTVGEFLRKIEYEEEFEDHESHSDDESLKTSRMTLGPLGPIQEDDEVETPTDEHSFSF